MLYFIKKHKLVTFLLGLLAIIILFALVLSLVNFKRVALGVTLADQNLGGMKYDAAKAKIERLVDLAKEQPIEIQYQQKRWTYLPQDLGIAFEPEKTAEVAFSVGRQNNFLVAMVDQIESLFFRKPIDISFSHNKQKVFDFAQKNLAEMENPAKNARLAYSEEIGDFVFEPAQGGEVFDICDLTSQIDSQTISFSKKPIVLKKIKQNPSITQDINDKAKDQARKIFDLAPYQLKYEGESWLVQKEILLDWLDFVRAESQDGQTMQTSISFSAVKNFLIELAPSINKAPVNAQLATQDGKVIAFALSQNGIELKTDESAQKISREIPLGKNKIELLAQEIEPAITSETIDTLGLVNLIGQGTSDFAGSPKNRVHNIRIGSAKINDILLKPGEEFSFVGQIGEIGAEQGYLPELVIKKGKTIPEYGGGICQISTTLFRAAVSSGLKITERYPHAFPVKYYNPQGFDATIYPPKPDLRFINDTQNNILIQSKIKGTQITFEIYGKNDGRETKIVGPTILQSNQDGSMKTVLYQEIYRNGELERRDQFWSNYKSPALYPVQRNPLE